MWTERAKESKKIKNGCDDCKYKCSEKNSNDEKQQIFTNFWNIQNGNLQTQYIFDVTFKHEQVRNVDIIKEKRHALFGY